MGLAIKRRKRRKKIGGELLVSPCRGCGREHKDKRYQECKYCSEPHAYAMAVEKVYSHLPPGIDCSKIYTSTNGQVKFLTEVRGVGFLG